MQLKHYRRNICTVSKAVTAKVSPIVVALVVEAVSKEQ